MKRKIVNLAFIAIVTLFAAGTALAEGTPSAKPDANTAQPPPSGEIGGCHDSSLAGAATLPLEAPWVSLALSNREKIRLTENQVRQLETLRTEFDRQAASQSDAMGVSERALQQILAAEPVDLSRVKAQLTEIGNARAAARLRRIETLLAGRAVLSRQQQSALQQQVAQAGSEMHRSMMGGMSMMNGMREMNPLSVPGKSM